VSNDTITIIEWDMLPDGEYSLSTHKLKHGDNIAGSNAVAVVEGQLCDCGWCMSLKRRCQSRRVA